MTVIVNEKKITLDERDGAAVTVATLLDEMNVPEKGTAVAAAEPLYSTYPDAAGFSPRNLGGCELG